MKEKLTNNLGLKLLSLLMATLLWLVVVNSQDPLETRTFTDIPVKIINEDSLTAKDKIPEVIEGDTITVVVEARRKICDMLTANDIVAVADFAKISLTDAVPIEVSVQGYTDNEVEIIRGMNRVMTLRLEDSVTKDFRVKISTTGEPASGYVIGDMVASPHLISVTGSSTQISKIKEVVLVVDIDGISKESYAVGTPVVYDMNGDVVNYNKVTVNTKEVEVTIPVLKTRTVKIMVNTVGEPAPGYEVSNISYQPDVVTVAGTPTDLVLLGTTLNMYCDITDKSDIIEENVDISSLWKEDLESLRVVDEEQLAVTITLKEYEEKVMEISENSVEVFGLSEQLDYEILELSQHQVRVKGKQARLKEVTLESLAPYIEFGGAVTPGIYTLPLILNDADGLVVTDVILVEVEVFEQLEESMKE